MPYKIEELDVDGKMSTFVKEKQENEVAMGFLEADAEAGEEVEVIYMIDEFTGEDIELWRKDWMIVKG